MPESNCCHLYHGCLVWTSRPPCREESWTVWVSPAMQWVQRCPRASLVREESGGKHTQRAGAGRGPSPIPSRDIQQTHQDTVRRMRTVQEDEDQIEKSSCVYWNRTCFKRGGQSLNSPRAALSNPHSHSLIRPKMIRLFLGGGTGYQTKVQGYCRKGF